ncbi:hypothetical protein D5272_19435 [bacterium D16-76]|nr:hypothetical protein [bacterium D16-76]
MLAMQEVKRIAEEMCRLVSKIFPQERIDAVLFGSYARGDAEEGSDIDILLLVDSSRETISEKSWQIGGAAAELLLNYGVLLSPIVENRQYFQSNSQLLPLFRNISAEGVPLSA